MKQEVTLKAARKAIRKGRLEEAGALLTALIRESPDCLEAWILASQAVEEPDRKIEYLREALRFNPGNSLLHSHLDMLESPVSIHFSNPSSAAETATRSHAPHPLEVRVLKLQLVLFLILGIGAAWVAMKHIELRREVNALASYRTSPDVDKAPSFLRH